MKNPLVKMSLQKRIAALLFFSMLIICFNSCTKTEIVEYEPEAKNRILAYKVRNTPHEILAAINQEQNTIDVRLPYYLGLDYILADITLDPGATLLDVDSVEINLLEDELQAVAIGDTIKYIVRSEDNQYRAYTITQEYTPHRDPLVLAFRNNSSTSNGKYYDGGDLFQRVRGSSLEGPVFIEGNFNSLSMESLKVYFTNQITGEKIEYKNPSKMNLDIGAENYVLSLGWLEDAPIGFFDVHVEHQGRQIDLPVGLAIAEHSMPTRNNLSGTIAFQDGTNAAPASFDKAFKKSEATITRTLDKRYEGSTAFIGVKRVYLKVDADAKFTQAPAGFVEDFVGKEIDIEILKSEKYELSFRFPNLPDGVYEMKSNDVLQTPFNVYVEYENNPELGIAWGKDNITWFFGGIQFDRTTNIRTLRFSVQN